MSVAAAAPPLLLCRRLPQMIRIVGYRTSQHQHQHQHQPSHAGADLDFSSPQSLSLSRSRSDLLRSLLVLHACSFDFFVSRSLACLRLGRLLLGERLFRWTMRRSFFGQFVGGETPEELRRTAVGQTKVGLLPMLAVPTEEPLTSSSSSSVSRRLWYDLNAEKMLAAVRLAATVAEETEQSAKVKMQLKVTALMPESSLARLSLRWPGGCVPCDCVQRLTDAIDGGVDDGGFFEDEELVEGLRRLGRVAEAARTLEVQLLIDAEYSTVNPGLTLVCLALSVRHNVGGGCLVFRTQQCYLRETEEELRECARFLRERRVKIGVKLVRGAYLDWERRRGEQLGQPTVWSTHAETNVCYDSALKNSLQTLSESPDSLELVVATHNTRSIGLCLSEMRRLNIDSSSSSSSVSFAQLYGMADYISCPLAYAGHRVYKSIPYGSVEETLPYLARRAAENRIVVEGAREEKRILLAALLLTGQQRRGRWRAAG